MSTARCLPSRSHERVPQPQSVEITAEVLRPDTQLGFRRTTGWWETKLSAESVYDWSFSLATKYSHLICTCSSHLLGVSGISRQDNRMFSLAWNHHIQLVQKLCFCHLQTRDRIRRPRAVPPQPFLDNGA